MGGSLFLYLGVNDLAPHVVNDIEYVINCFKKIGAIAIVNQVDKILAGC